VKNETRERSSQNASKHHIVPRMKMGEERRADRLNDKEEEGGMSGAD
jgi:hypothetical protein